MDTLLTHIVPAPSSPLRLVLEAAAVFFVGMLPFMLTAFPRRYAAANRQLSSPELLLSSWTRALAVVAVLLYIALGQPGGVASIGLHPGDVDRNLSDTLIGLFIFALFLSMMLVAIRLFRRQTGRPAPTVDDDGEPKLNDVARYTRLPERLSYLLVLVFMVIAEDLVSRGYLVLLLGTRLGNFVPAIILSICFTWVAHLYQGKKIGNLLLQTLFAAIFILLLLITRNLLAVIVGHVYYDIVWTVGRWRVLDRQGRPPAAPLTPIEKYYHPAFILINIAILAALAFLAGFGVSF